MATRQLLPQLKIRQGKLRGVWIPSGECRACDAVVELCFLGYRGPEQLHLILKLAMFGTRYGTRELKRSLSNLNFSESLVFFNVFPITGIL